MESEEEEEEEEEERRVGVVVSKADESKEDKTALNSGGLTSSTNSPSSRSSARCFLLRAAKSFKEILTFLSGTGGGKGEEKSDEAGVVMVVEAGERGDG